MSKSPARSAAFIESMKNEPRIIVTGGRDFDDYNRVMSILLEYAHLKPTIVHGTARGADTLAEEAAKALHYKLDPFPAKWDELGNSAGLIRNQEMIDSGADLVVAFPGKKGTRDCCRRAHEAKIHVRYA